MRVSRLEDTDKMEYNTNSGSCGKLFSPATSTASELCFSSSFQDWKVHFCHQGIKKLLALKIGLEINGHRTAPSQSKTTDLVGCNTFIVLYMLQVVLNKNPLHFVSCKTSLIKIEL